VQHGAGVGLGRRGSRWGAHLEVWACRGPAGWLGCGCEGEGRGGAASSSLASPGSPRDFRRARKAPVGRTSAPCRLHAVSIWQHLGGGAAAAWGGRVVACNGSVRGALLPVRGSASMHHDRSLAARASWASECLRTSVCTLQGRIARAARFCALAGKRPDQDKALHCRAYQGVNCVVSTVFEWLRRQRNLPRASLCGRRAYLPLCWSDQRNKRHHPRLL
jgi:hypothetical protein